jgi:hypothetical protein
MLQWKDGSSTWENLKESNPIETAEYAKIIGVDHEPAFNWWVPHVLKKRDRIILLVKKHNSQFLKRTHKFGIEVPKTVKEPLEIVRRNGNTFWANAIAKEMEDVCVAFEILLDGQPVPIGYQKIPCHMIFDTLKWKTFAARLDLLPEGTGPKPPQPLPTLALSLVRQFTLPF